MPSQELESLRERLVAMYDEARALGQHQVAYHALAAVLHAGESLHDIDTIDLVEKRAKEHAAWLNVNDPRHPMSAESASTRGNQSMFEQLAITAVAVRARIKAERLTRK